MSPEIQILLSGALTFGVPLILAVRELILLRRPPRGGWRPDPVPPTPTPPLSPAGQKPLPDCLIPRPIAGPRERVREMEPA